MPAARLVSLLSLVAVPLGSALAFVIQPMMAKHLLPRLGGTAAVWLGAVLFFQLALLAGYAWGLWLARRSVRVQLIASATLALVALVTFHAPAAHAGSPTVGGVMLALTLGCLPALVLLFSLSPWLHAWRERVGSAEPYALYALSNAGSLAVLALYPFAIEPPLDLSDQLGIWRGLFALLAAVVVSGAVLLWRSGDRLPGLAPAAWRSLSPWAVAAWVALSALACGVMLAASGLAAAEVGSTPLAWVGPLGVYLGSFALVFSGRWRPWMTGAAVAGLGLALAAYMALKGFGSETTDGARLIALVAVCGGVSLVAHALAHAARPERGGEWFYLALAIGGALGGAASLGVVPAVFARPVEFPIAAALVLAAGLFWGARWRHAGGAAACLALALGPVLILGARQSADEGEPGAVFHHYRDLHGHLKVKADHRSAVLSSATTTHGTQITEPPEARARPTLYYSESSGAGRALQALGELRPTLRVAVVGLGAGTVAAYARPGDEYVFYDIDPKIEAVARRHFTYLADCRGTVRVELADGRRALAEAREDFDVVLIDAFMGDGVPAHLLTVEALRVYQERLRARDGLLLVHASLRYSRLLPVFAATAHATGWETLEVLTDIDEALEDKDWDAVRSTWLLAGSPERARQWSAWFAVEEDGGRVRRELSRLSSLMAGPRQLWTDERPAALDVLDVGAWLSRPAE